ncbi:uncharacterized protein [Eucyclogobius newberryi]|uniref:uncharacterized protein n=1 Tax=Eucyclogobius newberryi TaxID=166745 RepID=UPI003B5A435E
MRICGIKGAAMESKSKPGSGSWSGPGSGPGSLWALVLGACTCLSLACTSVCLLVLLRSPHDLEPLVLGILDSRLDALLDQKLSERLPKIRETRDASFSCLCPPGTQHT